ncbi:MAG: glycosyltransferase [Desulfovibrio sp.]|jgi:glycosyltransferase involved in cell wall biosynthesis|nr:glycosyltransferase [Desulfovibrio sp.]
MNAHDRNQPPRMMQITTFYDAYLRALYAAHPRLAQESCRRQTEVIIRDAFSGIHTLTPYLPKRHMEAEFVVGNCFPLQAAWATEHGLTGFTKDWQDDLLHKRIEEFRPDILYFQDTIRFDARFLQRLSFTPRLVCGWRGADIPFDTDWHGFDLILSGLPRILALATALGATDSAYFVPGMPAWIAREVGKIPHEVDVVFVGGVSPTQHVRRLALLEALAEAATRREFSLELYLSCDRRLISEAMQTFVKPPVFGLDMHRALRRGRIVFDTRGCIGLLRKDGSRHLDLAGGDTVNMRLFEGTGGGSLVITDALPGLSRLFEPGEEVVTFQDEGDLVEKILYYLAHPEEREHIARKGKERCLTQWNMAARAREFITIVNRKLTEE